MHAIEDLFVLRIVTVAVSLAIRLHNRTHKTILYLMFICQIFIISQSISVVCYETFQHLLLGSYILAAAGKVNAVIYIYIYI